MTTTHEGVRAGVSDLEYHADRSSLSASGAKLLLPPSCPAKFKQRMDDPPPSTPVFDFGKLAHKLVLGEGADIAVLDPAIHGLKKDGAIADSPTATAMWKQADSEARAHGATPVHVDDYRKAAEMAEQVRNHPLAGPLFDDGHAEVSLYADDPETGVRLRARPDWMKTPGDRLTIVDYKTCLDANPATFGRTAERWGYHIQMAWYITVARLLKLDGMPTFLFVCQEKTPPYLVSVNELDTEAFQVGQRRMREALAIYRHCTDTGEWPGYPMEINLVSLPPWAVEEEMEISA